MRTAMSKSSSTQLESWIATMSQALLTSFKKEQEEAAFKRMKVVNQTDNL